MYARRHHLSTKVNPYQGGRQSRRGVHADSSVSLPTSEGGDCPARGQGLSGDCLLGERLAGRAVEERIRGQGSSLIGLIGRGQLKDPAHATDLDVLPALVVSGRGNHGHPWWK